MTKTLSALGVLLTAAYLIAVFWLFEGRVEEIRGMPPNNVGDFLAGVFGPLAILWLILGFFQQGIELRQNTRALELQAAELKNSVEQQRELVDVTRLQVNAEIAAVQAEQRRQQEAARPKFVFHGAGAMISGGHARYSSRIKNLGNTATDVSIVPSMNLSSCSLSKVFSWSHGEEQRIEWSYATNLAEEPMVLTISYVDAFGTPGEQKFSVVPNLAAEHHMVEIKAAATNDGALRP